MAIVAARRVRAKAIRVEYPTAAITSVVASVVSCVAGPGRRITVATVVITLGSIARRVAIVVANPRVWAIRIALCRFSDAVARVESGAACIANKLT